MVYDLELEKQFCPRCEFGRIRVTVHPYLELCEGHLLCIPRATCYRCDACNHITFADGVMEVIDDMMLALIRELDDTPPLDASTRLAATLPEDDSGTPAQALDA